MIRTHYSGELKPSMDGRKVVVAGWVQHHRVLRNLIFVKLRDRSGIVQITLPKAKVSERIYKQTSSLSPESVVAFGGKVKKSKEAHGGLEIIPDAIEVINKANSPLPLDISGKIDSELETRLNSRFMDLRNPKKKAIFQIRDAALIGLRAFCEADGFIEVHTPKIVSAGAEGGATLFPVKYFGAEAYLSQSPQLFKQTLMATGFDKIYEISPYFRAEKSATSRHLTEFTQWDAEMAFITNFEDVMDFLEKTIVHALKHVKKSHKTQLDLLDIDLRMPHHPFQRITYKDAVQVLARHGKKVPKDRDLDSEAEKKLGEIMLKKGYDMYFITEYPESEKPFYIMEKGDKSYSFDLAYKGLEIASGGQREHRLDMLISRMKKQKLNLKSFEFYLNSFKYGMPSHGGFGFGVDRLVQQMLNLQNIREAVLFPRDLKRLVP
jgi:aspartyl-tRNA synthetase